MTRIRKTPPSFQELAHTSTLGILTAAGSGIVLGATALSGGVPAVLVTLGATAAIIAVNSLTRKVIRNWSEALTEFRGKAKLLTEASPDGIWMFNAATGETFFSKHLRSRLNLAEGDDISALLAVFGSVSADEGRQALARWANLLDNGTPFSLELRIRSDGEAKWFRWNGRTASKSLNDPVYFGSLACTHDMRAIEESINDIALLSVESPNPVFRISPKGEVLIANKAATPLLDNWKIGPGGELPGSLVQLITPIMETGQQFEMEFGCGERLYGALFVPHLLGKGYVNVYCTDITERARANQALEESRRRIQELNEHNHYMAQHDNLTGLANRRLFEEKLHTEMERSKRYKTIFALMMLDLDKFKHINDNYGHDAGDTVLKFVATKLKSSVRACDIPARLGGDEFALLVPDLREESNACAIAEKIIAGIAAPIEHGIHTLRTTPSIGIAFFYGEDTVCPDDLFKHADLALYTAKASGRNAYRVYAPEMQEVAPESATSH